MRELQLSTSTTGCNSNALAGCSYASVEIHEESIAAARMSEQGRGKRLMHRIIDYARGRDVGALYGEVVADNYRM